MTSIVSNRANPSGKSSPPRLATRLRFRYDRSVRELNRAPVAQLDRASVYGTEGYWFESSRVYSRQSTTQGGRMRPDRLFYWPNPPLTLTHPIPSSRQDATESDSKRPLSGSK